MDLNNFVPFIGPIPILVGIISGMRLRASLYRRLKHARYKVRGDGTGAVEMLLFSASVSSIVVGSFSYFCVDQYGKIGVLIHFERNWPMLTACLLNGLVCAAIDFWFVKSVRVSPFVDRARTKIRSWSAARTFTLVMTSAATCLLVLLIAFNVPLTLVPLRARIDWSYWVLSFALGDLRQQAAWMFLLGGGIGWLIYYVLLLAWFGLARAIETKGTHDNE